MPRSKQLATAAFSAFLGSSLSPFADASALQLTTSIRDIQATSAVSVLGVGEDSDGDIDAGPTSGPWTSRELQSISSVSDSLAGAGAGSSAEISPSTVSVAPTSLTVSSESTVTSLSIIDDIIDASGASASGESVTVVSFTTDSRVAYLLSGGVSVNLFSDLLAPGTREGAPFAGVELFEGPAGGGDPGGADTIAIVFRTDTAADGVTSSGSIDRTGTLPPGTYTIQATAMAEHSTGGGLVDIQMGASYSFGFSVQEVPEPNKPVGAWFALLTGGILYWRSGRMRRQRADNSTSAAA